MSSDIATIRAAIKAKLQGVTGIGVVNDYERYTKEQGPLREMYVATISGEDQLRGWHIRRIRTREIFVDMGRWELQTWWAIRGFMALNDAAESEKTFDDLVEAVRDAFRADHNLGGAVFSTIDPNSSEAGIQLVKSEPVLFAGVLCHSAQCQLFTQYLK